MRTFITIMVCLIALFSISTAQDNHKKFPEKVLNSPIDFAEWFDTQISIEEIYNYKASEGDLRLMLENGYAEHKLKDRIPRKYFESNLIPKSVEIVFTKYPLRKEDWITNYYLLLANRLKELFEIDSSLNSSSVEWKLVIQTKGVTEAGAKKLFHGIIITYENKDLSQIQGNKPELLLVEENKKIVNYEYTPETVIPEREKVESIEDMGILYPQSIRKKGLKPVIPKKIKNPDEPECPKFPARNERPKRSGLF